jgi:hypothetical protein
MFLKIINSFYNFKYFDNSITTNIYEWKKIKIIFKIILVGEKEIGKTKPNTEKTFKENYLLTFVNYRL